MGTIREFKCPSCYGTWRLRLGHGVMHGTLEHVLKAFPSDIQLKIFEDTKGDPAPLFNFNYRAAVCSECQDVVAVPVIYLHKTKHSYSSGCPECGSTSLIQKEDPQFICPQCKISHLLAQNIGNWD